MNKSVELSIIDPIYSTYHYQGSSTAILKENPSIRNWYLNEVLILKCNRKFLSGYTTPNLTIEKSQIKDNPYLENVSLPKEVLGSATNAMIKNFLDAGYYVYYAGVDDYYVEGKSWYHRRHFLHDGMICGYSREENTLTLYAYDEKWLYRVFKTSQRCFDKGRRAALRQGKYCSICGLKPKTDIVKFDPAILLPKLQEYLDSSLEKYSPNAEGDVFGIAVQDYLLMYMDKIADESIPYERKDVRIFRMLWEHKKVMLERIRKVEEVLGLSADISNRYERIVKSGDNIRMLYASYAIKRRDSLITAIKKELVDIRKLEQVLLNDLVSKMEVKLKKCNYGDTYVIT